MGLIGGAHVLDSCCSPSRLSVVLAQALGRGPILAVAVLAHSVAASSFVASAQDCGSTYGWHACYERAERALLGGDYATAEQLVADMMKSRAGKKEDSARPGTGSDAYPYFPNALLAQIHLGLGRLDAAEQAARETIDPRKSDILGQIRDARQQAAANATPPPVPVPVPTEEPTLSILRRGMEDYRAGRFGEAERVFNEALGRGDGHRRTAAYAIYAIRLKQVWGAIRAADHTTAVRLLEGARSVAAEYSLVGRLAELDLVLGAFLLAESGDRDGARREFEKVPPQLARNLSACLADGASAQTREFLIDYLGTDRR